MPSKKHLKRKGKGFTKLVGSKPFDKKLAKQLPDTSRIPWLETIPKIGTDA